MAKEINMTTGHPAKLLLRFSFPLMIANVINLLYTVVDSIIVGQAVGVTALAALGAVAFPYLIFAGASRAMTEGFGVKIAEYFGGGDEKSLRNVVKNALLLTLIISLVIAIVGFFASGPLLVITNTPKSVQPYGKLYFRILCVGLPVTMIYSMLATILRAFGNSKTPLYAVTISCVINIVLDVLFVVIFHWNVVGAAVATVIAQLSSCIPCALQLKKLNVLWQEDPDNKINRNTCRELLSLGVPLSLQGGIIFIGNLVVQSVINSQGELVLAGFTATGKLYGLLEVATSSFGYATTTYVSQNVGGKNFRRILSGIKSIGIIALSTSLILMVILLAFGRFMLSGFISAADPNAPAILQIGYEYLTTMCKFLPVLYLLYIFRSSIQGMGNTIIPMVSGIVELIVRVMTVLTLPKFVGLSGIYLNDVNAWIAACLLLAIAAVVCLKNMKKKLSAA